MLQEERRPRNFEITIRVLEGKLLKDTSTMLFQMKTYVTIDLEKAEKQFKTQAQAGGKAPKWNEKFEFICTEKGEKINIAIWEKNLMQSDLKKGSTNLQLSMVNSYNTTDWFIVADDKQEQIGSILLNITS